MTIPAIASHIDIYNSSDGNITVFNHNTDKTYSLGHKEAEVLKHLDGIRSLSDLQTECPFYTEAQLGELISTFDNLGFFGKKKKKLSILKLKLRIFNPNRLFQTNSFFTCFIASLIIFCGCIFPAVSLSTAFITSHFGLTSLNVEAVYSAFTSLHFSDYVLILLGTYLSLFLHELGHAITARRYDVPVSEIGIMLYYFIPCAYTNVSAINLMTSKRKRILVLSAGTFVNTAIIGLCHISMIFCGNPHTAAILFGILLTNLLTVFTNGMIFLKFDGYYIIEVLTDKLQLREKATVYFRSLISFRHSAKKSNLSFIDRLLYTIYGAATCLYVPLIFANTAFSVIQYFMR